MNQNDLSIRHEAEADHRFVECLVRDAFWNVYRPGCLEHYVLHTMRTHPAFIPELNFVLEKDGEIIGQYGPPACYLVDEEAAEIFDRSFPPKEKRKLPGQLL